MPSESTKKQAIGTPVIAIGALLLQITLIAYFFETIHDNLLIGSYHPLKIIFTALSSTIFIVATIFFSNKSRAYKILIIGSIILNLLAIYHGLIDIAIAVNAPILISGIFSLFNTKRTILALQFSLIVLISIAATYHAISEELYAKTAVATALTDPDSAKFKNLRSTKWALGDFVCGEVNAKNKMGGYSGYEGFYYIKPKIVFYSDLNNQWIDRNSSNLTKSCLITIFNSTGTEIPSWLK